MCFKCLKESHFGRDCQDDPVSMEFLASQPELEAAPVAPIQGEVISVARKPLPR